MSSSRSSSCSPPPLPLLLLLLLVYYYYSSSSLSSSSHTCSCYWRSSMHMQILTTAAHRDMRQPKHSPVKAEIMIALASFPPVFSCSWFLSIARTHSHCFSFLLSFFLSFILSSSSPPFPHLFILLSPLFFLLLFFLFLFFSAVCPPFM